MLPDKSPRTTLDFVAIPRGRPSLAQLSFDWE